MNWPTAVATSVIALSFALTLSAVFGSKKDKRDDKDR